MITTGGIMCIMRLCSINGSGTSANMNTPREQYAASSSINRLLHVPLLLPPLGFKWFFFALHSPSAFSLYSPFFFIDHRSFRFLSSPSKMLRRESIAGTAGIRGCGAHFRSISSWPLRPFRRLCESEDSSDFIFTTNYGKFVFSELRGWNYNLISDVDIFWMQKI